MDSVLIVDDERFFLTVLGDFVIERLQMHPLLAPDGPTALSLLEKQPVELVLLDIIMPGMDGLELLRRIKDRSPSLPVIMVTGSDSIDDAITALCEGADDFVRKPVDFDELQLCVTRTMSKMRVDKLPPPNPPPSFGRERRKAPRVRMRGEPTALVELKQLKDVSLIDLSLSGALMEHTEPVRPGGIYRLSFSVGGSQVQVLARAVRAYASHFVTLAGGERQLVFRTGMEFIGVEKAAADLISAYVEHLRKQPGRGSATESPDGDRVPPSRKGDPGPQHATHGVDGQRIASVSLERLREGQDEF